MPEKPRTWMQKLDLQKPLPGHRPRQLSPRQIDEVRQAMADGATPQELSVQYGVPAWTIRRYRPS